MKRTAHIVSIALLFGAVACHSSPDQQENVLEQQVTDSVSATVEEVADTTLQPKVAVTLHAVGETPEGMAYDLDTIIVPKDALITLTLINTGSDLNAIHNFVLVNEGMYKEAGISGAEIGSSGNYIPKNEHVFTATPLALPGQTIAHEFEAPPPGTYDFVCTYPDHWKTMHGKLIVK